MKWKISVCIFPAPWGGNKKLGFWEEFQPRFLLTLSRLMKICQCSQEKTVQSLGCPWSHTLSLPWFGSPRITQLRGFETRTVSPYTSSGIFTLIMQTNSLSLSVLWLLVCKFWMNISVPQPHLVAMRIGALACWNIHQTHEGARKKAFSTHLWRV